MTEEFGKLLRKHRKENGLTIDKLVGLLEDNQFPRSKGTISKWENNESQPRFEVIEALEDILGVTRGVLLRAAEYEYENEQSEGKRKVQIDSIIMRKKEEHFNNLANICSMLLANDLDDVMINPFRDKGDPFDKFKYSVGTTEDGYGIKDDAELATKLDNNLQFTLDQFGTFDLECLMDHLKAESADLSKWRFRTVMWENPYKIIEILRVLSRSKVFRGTCSVCKSQIE